MRLLKEIRSKGFTLIELLVVIAIISLLASVLLASLTTARAKARDATRLSDMHQMEIALELYFTTYGTYPNSDSLGTGGWDVSGDGTFITPLVAGKFLNSNLHDPTPAMDALINIGDGRINGNYRYYFYNAGSGGCDASRGRFYVLGVVDMETSGRPHPASPGWSCPGRNWGAEDDWVTGKYVN